MDAQLTTLRLDDLARAAVTAVAPEQLGDLDDAAAAWEAGRLPDGSGDPGQWHGGAVGSGIVWGAVVYLVFPIISGAVANALGTPLHKGPRWWPVRRHHDEPQQLAALPLAQAEKIRAGCVDRALRAGLRPEQADAMGDAVYVAFLRAASGNDR